MSNPINQSASAKVAADLDPHPATDVGTFTVGDALHVIWSRRGILAAFTLVGLIVGAYFFAGSRQYTADSTLRVQPGGNGSIAVNPLAGLSGQEDTKINSELAMLGSRYIRLKVAKDLNLTSNREFWGKTPPSGNLDSPHMRDLVVLRMAKIVTVTHNPRSEIISISCTTASPLLSSQIVNTLVNEYIGYTFQLRYGSTERVSKWLVSQLDDLKNQVESDQTELVNLQNKLGVLGLDPKSSDYLLADSLGGLAKAEGEASIDRIVAEARYRYLNDTDPNLIENEQPLLSSSTVPQNGLLSSLRSAQAQAQAEYSQESSRFGANYPDVKLAKARLDALNREIQAEQKRIVNQAKLDYSAAAANEKMTNQLLASRKNEAFQSRGDMVRYLILQREYESHRTLYETLIQHLRVAGINAGLESAQVDVIDVADVPSIPRNPLPFEKALIALVLLPILGCIVALVVDYFDDTLDSVEEIERCTGLQALTHLPSFDAPSSLKSAVFGEIDSEQSGYAEGMQLLRSSLLSLTNGKLQSLLVTSAIPGEGKSTVTRNLAAMFAKHGSRVLLIDADLRKPTVHSALRIRRSPGLGDLLIKGDLTLTDVVTPVASVENMFVLTAGTGVFQAATLLSSDRMAALVADATAKFDIVLMDMPPVLSVSEPVLCSPLVDLTVLVVRQHTVNAHQERQAMELLLRGGANLGGFVLNATQERWSRYGAYYANYGDYGESPTPGSAA